MRLWREESFGPVKAIIRVHSEEEALAVADSEYGLSAAVYSRERQSVERSATSAYRDLPYQWPNGA